MFKSPTLMLKRSHTQSPVKNKDSAHVLGSREGVESLENELVRELVTPLLQSNGWVHKSITSDDVFCTRRRREAKKHACS